ncbi:hypothetical protein ACROYT_G033485 [Oculina patagonica]
MRKRCSRPKQNCRYIEIQPRPQSSPANLDVTSPAKLVGEVRLGRLAINGKSNMAEPVQRLNFSQLLEELKNASELGWDSFIHVCQQTPEVIGDFLFKKDGLVQADQVSSAGNVIHFLWADLKYQENMKT